MRKTKPVVEHRRKDLSFNPLGASDEAFEGWERRATDLERRYPNSDQFLSRFMAQLETRPAWQKSYQRLVDGGVDGAMIVAHLARFTLPGILPTERITAQNERRRLETHADKVTAFLKELRSIARTPTLARQLDSGSVEVIVDRYATVVQQVAAGHLRRTSARGNRAIRDDVYLVSLWKRIRTATGKDHWTALAGVTSAAIAARYPGTSDEELDLHTVKKIVLRHNLKATK